MAAQKEIFLGDRLISYRLRISCRARHLRLNIGYKTGLIVTAPHFFPQEKIDEFIFRQTRWILKKLRYFSKLKYRPYLLAGNKNQYHQQKNVALELAKEKIIHFNQNYRFNLGRVSIKNQKTRWGSCSRKGNLNFNYKIALLPEHIADYIIVHELCHLAEFNHSKNFWSLVAKTIPDYKLRIKEIRI